MKALGPEEGREAVRLNATVPDAPTWEKVQKAWYAVGADVAGLDWSAFVRKASAAPAAPQPVQAVPDEPDWRHPKIQGLIGSEARLRIAIDLIWQILEDPNQEFTASDMEYWDTIHDKLKAALSAAPVAPAAPQPAQPLTDEKDALDLLAVLFDAYENGPSCYEDPDEMAVYIGNAIKIDDDTFEKCVDLLNRRRPRILTEGVKND